MRRFGLFVLMAVALLPVACRQRQEVGVSESGIAQAESSESQTLFIERAEALGLDFVHFNGMAGKYYYPEMMGGGGALFDYDGDGDLDLYLVQGEMLGGEELNEALFPPRHGELTDRLYRNDLLVTPEGSAEPRFVDVTGRMGLEARGYGMGVASGDFDNDGWVDLYVTNFGSNRLLRNRGNGTFQDVTDQAGVDDARWSVGATFFDYDRDGRLDLYVGNYLDYRIAGDKVCLDAAGARDWCGPMTYGGVTDRLFHNRGNGTLEDVSGSSGVGRLRGRGLGAVVADFDRDGWLDLYVTNDGEPNYLWINQRDGTFRDEALISGCAVSGDGLPQASMGVDAGDYDGDGDLDLFMTHLTGETNALFRNEGDLSFTDVTASAGLGAPSLPFTSFGTRWFDFDNDGLLDLITANGAVKRIGELAQAGDPYPLHQKKLLFHHLRGGSFEEIGATAGVAFEPSETGRGAAFGDVDNDGDTDVVVVNSNGPARLLVNQIGEAFTWIGCSVGSRGSVAVSEITLQTLGGRMLLRRVGTDGSYASASDSRVIFGLGDSWEPNTVTIGAERTRSWRELRPGRYYRLQSPG
jgi:hypothetical protein